MHFRARRGFDADRFDVIKLTPISFARIDVKPIVRRTDLMEPFSFPAKFEYIIFVHISTVDKQMHGIMLTKLLQGSMVFLKRAKLDGVQELNLYLLILL